MSRDVESKIKAGFSKDGDGIIDVKNSQKKREAFNHIAILLIMKSLVFSIRSIIVFMAFFVISVGFIYLLSIVLVPFYPKWESILVATKDLFYNIYSLLPWILLLVIGDKESLKKLLISSVKK